MKTRKRDQKAARKAVILAAWERGKTQWNPDTHGRGLGPLFIPAENRMTHNESVEYGPLQLPAQLEFRLERAAASGRLYDAIVCEGVVVATIRDGEIVDEK
jgi:hypothetical protein